MICILLFSPAENSLVTSCEGLTKYGSFLYVDFYQINRPCTCIVTTMFVGELLVISWEVDVAVCNTQIVIDKSVIMGCPLQHLTSQTLDVQMNQSVDVRAEYKLPSTPGTFYQCIGFRQNGIIIKLSQCLKILNFIFVMLFLIMICLINILD